MANIFREVDEDIRKERYINLFRKYGFYLVGLIFIIVGSLSGIQFYSSYQINKNEMLVLEYVNIIESDPKEALEKLANTSENSNTFLNGMNLLKRTDLLIANNQIDEATFLLKTAIDGKNLIKIHHDVAIYKLLMINLELISFGDFESYQSKLLSKEDVFYLTEELIAIKYLIEGNKEESIKKLKELSFDINAPIEVKNRSAVFIKIATQ